MSYRQITPEERYMLAQLRKQRLPIAEIARLMGRDRSSIYRELRRNRTREDGRYRAFTAQEQTNGRRRRSRRNSQFTAEDWSMVEHLLRSGLSPEQISGRLKRDGVLSISHETIYTHIWNNKAKGGLLYLTLRQPTKRRKRYGTNEKRGQVAGKRHISERPPEVDERGEIGHWEGDTVIGAGSKHCVITLVERVTGVTLIGKLEERTTRAVNDWLIPRIRKTPELFKTITVDNGTEFHSYLDVEAATGVEFYFATPYHSWERGTNENTNGLIRQYIPKGMDLRSLSQAHCSLVAALLNHRPRKRHEYMTPLERLDENPHLRATVQDAA